MAIALRVSDLSEIREAGRFHNCSFGGGAYLKLGSRTSDKPPARQSRLRDREISACL